MLSAYNPYSSMMKNHLQYKHIGSFLQAFLNPAYSTCPFIPSPFFTVKSPFIAYRSFQKGLLVRVTSAQNSCSCGTEKRGPKSAKILSSIQKYIAVDIGIYQGFEINSGNGSGGGPRLQLREKRWIIWIDNEIHLV